MGVWFFFLDPQLVRDTNLVGVGVGGVNYRDGIGSRSDSARSTVDNATVTTATVNSVALVVTAQGTDRSRPVSRIFGPRNDSGPNRAVPDRRPNARERSLPLSILPPATIPLNG